MGKSVRLKQEYRKLASKLHKAVGNMLRTNPIFSSYRIYQEYPVNRICKYFDSGRERFDWIIIDLQVVIECHGKQHYEPVRFGGMTQEEAKARFQDQVIRDLQKKQAAQRAGWISVVFKYDEKDITINALMAKIIAENDLVENQRISKQTSNITHKQAIKKRLPKEGYYQQQLERAREYRKKQYRKQKERKDGNKNR